MFLIMFEVPALPGIDHADLYADAGRLSAGDVLERKAHQLGVDGIPVKYIVKPCTSNGIYVPTKAVDF